MIQNVMLKNGILQSQSRVIRLGYRTYSGRVILSVCQTCCEAESIHIHGNQNVARHD